MAELKHTFTSGRMNKDLDERLIPNGEYIDAQNIQISSSEGSDVGAIENLLGNEKLSKLNLKNAKTLGSIAYNLKDKIYWIVTSDNIDGIYEFDEKQQTVSPILIDSKETKSINLNSATVYSNVDNELIIESVNPGSIKELIGGDLPGAVDEEKLVKNNIYISSVDPYIRISIPKNTVIKKDTNGKIVFKNVEYNGKKYRVDFKARYTSNGILNFSKNNLITGINIVDDLLFWTDNLNQPRRINISSFKKHTDDEFNKDTQIEYAEKDPTTKQVTKLKRNFTEDDISVIKKSPMYAPSMELYDSVTDGIVDIKYTLNLSNLYIGQIFTLSNLTEVPSWNIGDFVTIQSDAADFVLDASVKSVTDTAVELSLATISGNIDNISYDCNINLKQKKALYELNFVRFAYRWKYKNGEYSTLSPFTEPAFIPDEFKYDGKEAFNYGMINKLQRVILNNFDLGKDDIAEIDILFKEGRNQNIYVLKTIKKLDFTNEYIITKEQIHSVIPNDQLLRAWDNVPKRAKAQEVTANRVIYGNYTQNYDVYSEPDISISTVARQDDLNRTIKSNRTYQIGVAYIDEYNRHTPVLSNDTGAFDITKDNSVLKNQFSLTLNNQPPAWAKHFKYYIKDTSGEYYNLSADKYYQDVENGFTYISFPSSDRNKVTNDHYLILKKKHGANEAVLDKDNRYKIIDIFSDPPEFITNRKRVVYSLGDIVFTDDYAGASGGNTITNRNQTDAANGSPVEEYATFQMKKTGDGQDSGSGVPIADANELKPGRFIKFTFGDKESDAYEIKSVQQHPSGSNEVKVTVTEPFGDDVNVIYSKVAPFNLGDSGTNLGVSINILETYSAAGDKEFDGRFFIKLKTNGVLTNSIVSESIGDVSYLAKDSININGIFRKDYDNDNRNDNNFDNTSRYRTNAITNSPAPFLVYEGGSAGSSINIGGLSYNITFEQATWKSTEQFDRLVRLIKVGDFIRFKNEDGTLHHDAIYEVGAKRTSSREKKRSFATNRDFKQLSLYLIDTETAESKPFETSIVTQGQDNEVVMEVLQKLDEENIIIKDPAIFETEPLGRKTELDIYYETEKAISIEEHGQTHTLNWYNAISFGNGVESNRIRDDFNAIFIDTGVRASTVLAEPFKEEHKFNGLIWSGIINSRSGTNQSNQFNMANTITKDLLPSYGSVQKLFARDGDIVIYCEDKIVRALADKDILYNADGSANVTASRNVIGNVIPFAGEYGISQNPESFAFYGFRAYNADPKRGVVLRLSQDGITPISAANMGSYFRNTLFGYDSEIIGSYDNRNKLYNLSYGSDTICFSEDVNGWVTFKSFLPQNGVSLNNIYYSYYDAELWQHDFVDAIRNRFYGEQYYSSIELNINDNPSVVKKYKTLGYEGTEGWKASVFTDQQTSSELTFKEKENKYFVNITGEAKELNTIDTKNFSAQGLGRSVRKTSISFTTGDVVAGQNGEIIILGAGNTAVGPDYIITGGNIIYTPNPDGTITVNGTNVSGSSGTGNTTGGTTVSTGGGTVTVNDSASNTTGDFSDTGGGGTTVNDEDPYVDQVGDVGNTTTTLDLDLNGTGFYTKPVEITQKPGEQISQAVFTIYPEDGYQITASDFVSSELDSNGNNNIVFEQDGDNVKAIVTINENQSSDDNTLVYSVTATADKKPIEIKGTPQLSLTNATIDNTDVDSYQVSGNYGEEKIISERIITADDGYYLTADSITVDNPNVILEKIKLSDKSYKIIETVFVPKNTTSDNNYTITVTPLEVVLPDPKIISKTINTGVIPNISETRELIVNGEQNAKFEVVLSDTSGLISKESYTIDVTGKKTIPIIFDSSDAAETYTLKINSLTGTDVDTSFGNQTITLTRNQKGRKTATFLVKYSNTVNNTFSIEDYIGQGTNRQFTFDLTLPAGTYTIGKQPASTDVVLGDNDNGAFVLLNNIEFDAVNTNVLTVSGTLFVSDFQQDETYTLDISPFVGKDVTTTFASSVNASDGNPAGNFTIAATSYTVDGGSGLNSTPAETEYFFTLTPSATYEFDSAIDADDFELLDASNNDVTADYAANGELLLRKVGDTIEVGFKSKTFIQPSATSTFTLRPKIGVTLTQAEVTTNVTKYTLKVNIKYTVDGVLSDTGTITRSVTNFDSTGQTLFPIYQYLSGRINSGAIDITEFSDNTLFYIDNTNNTEVTLAPAGSYTNDNGDAVTTTAEYEFTPSTNILVTNLLIDLNSDATISFNEVDIYTNLNSNKTIDANGDVITKYHLVEVKLAGCAEQVNGPNENDRSWSPINESSNVYPKYYATNSLLNEDVRIFVRNNSNETIPGNLASFTATNLIQKNNEKLFTVSTKNITSGTQAGWLFDKGVCSLDGSHLKLFTNTKKHELYNDIIKYSYPISSTIFKNEKQTLTGSIKIDNKTNYDAIVQDISSKGFNIKPVQGASIDAGTLTFTYDAYFDNNGNSSFDFQLLRGSGEYKIDFAFDDVTADSTFNKLSGTSYEMRRRSIDDQDNNDHISQATLNTYNVIEDYNTTSSLSRYDDGSGDYDGTANRITTNAPSGGGAYGYTGDAADIKIIPQQYLDNNNVLEFLNGTTWSNIMTDDFDWVLSSKAPADIKNGPNYIRQTYITSDGPLTGKIDYTKTGYTVILPNPGASGDLAAFLGLWVAIDQGTVTSLKIPIDLIMPSSLYVNDPTVIAEERVSLDIAGTLINTTTDGDGTAAVEENGWWRNPIVGITYDWTDRWKNYYIGGGNNVYISETQGPNGLKALPNYSGIQFTFGITMPTYIDNIRTMAFAKLPFRITGFKNIINANYSDHYMKNNFVSYYEGNNWSKSFHEKWANSATMKKLMNNRLSHGTWNGARYLKFKTYHS